MSRLAMVVTAVAVLAAGCGTSGGTVEKPTMTQAQALARVEQLIMGTADVITPKPRLDLYRPSLNIGKCLDPTDGGSENRIEISRIYYLRGIPKDQRLEVANQVKQYWQQQGHLVTGVSKNGFNISGRSRPDDFLLAFDRIGDDLLSLGATSPCIWPNRTPELSSGA